jgi:uncharacterized protein YndB with AHSA1/START domain
MATMLETAAALRVERDFAASRERVFRTWIDPSAAKVWFAPPGAVWTEPLVLEPRPGGRFRFRVNVVGKVYTVHGSFHHIVRPERLLFTWEWEDDPDRGDSGKSLVTVELHDQGRKTELVLTQSGFPSESSRQAHRARWEDCLGTIARLVE